MSVRDIRTLRGIAREFNHYLDSHIKTDNAFFTHLKRNIFLKKRAERLQAYFERIHTRIRENLKKAFDLTTQAEERIGNGSDPKKEMTAILEHLHSFIELLYATKKRETIRFGLTSEYDSLCELYNELKKEGYDKDVLELITDQIQCMYRTTYQERFRDIVRMKDDISRKVQSSFKVKRNMISLNRPKVDERFYIGHARAHLEIFFDKGLTDERMASLLENHANVLSGRIDTYLEKSDAPVLGRIKNRIDSKAHSLKGKSIRKIQGMWLDDLRKVCMDILKNNNDLILTPAFRYQVRIEGDTGTLAYCDPHSMIDHYLIRLDIDLIIIYHLISDDIHESFPVALITQLDQCLRPNQSKGKTTGSSGKDSVQESISKINAAAGNYRKLSLPILITHETQHAFDKKWLSWIQRVKPMLNYLIQEAQLYQDEDPLNIGPGLMQLANFYLGCRVEAPSQFREFITKHEKAMRGHEIYSLVNPIPSIGFRDAVRHMNTLIQKLEKDPSQTPDLTSLQHPFSHLMNITIFLADCKRKNVDIVLLDQKSLNALYDAFPRAAPALFGYSGLSEVPEGSPGWFLLRTVSEGTNDHFTQMLEEHNITWFSLDDIPSLIEENTSFYIFRPSMQAMRETLKKIEFSYEVTYMDMYERACDTLRIPENERLLSIRRVKALARELFKAHERIIRDVGFNT